MRRGGTYSTRCNGSTSKGLSPSEKRIRMRQARSGSRYGIRDMARPKGEATCSIDGDEAELRPLQLLTSSVPNRTVVPLYPPPRYRHARRKPDREANGPRAATKGVGEVSYRPTAILVLVLLGLAGPAKARSSDDHHRQSEPSLAWAAYHPLVQTSVATELPHQARIYTAKPCTGRRRHRTGSQFGFPSSQTRMGGPKATHNREMPRQIVGPPRPSRSLYRSRAPPDPSSHLNPRYAPYPKRDGTSL